MQSIYCDGSCRGNGKVGRAVGGYGVVVVDEHNHMVDEYQENNIHDTTNNRMELTGLIWSLKHAVANPDIQFTIFCDSAYGCNMFNKWIFGWKTNDWKTSTGKTPENLDLVHHLYEFKNRKGKNFTIQKCAGHSDCEWNNYADGLATGSIKVGGANFE